MNKPQAIQTTPPTIPPSHTLAVLSFMISPVPVFLNPDKCTPAVRRGGELRDAFLGGEIPSASLGIAGPRVVSHRFSPASGSCAWLKRRNLRGSKRKIQNFMLGEPVR